jgi:hypothetical protein
MRVTGLLFPFPAEKKMTSKTSHSGPEKREWLRSVNVGERSLQPIRHRQQVDGLVQN